MPSLAINVARLQWLFDIRLTGIQILPRFQRARLDHVRVESSSCCFPRELVSFVRPRELVSFDPWHVTSSPPIRKCILVGRYKVVSFYSLDAV